ncbi:MAG: hypothetical protein K6E97_04955 [Treponema sp.]|nr:hypothetical protein [Treponema sp.]
MKVNKKTLIPFLFYYFTNIFFAQNYIKAEVKSFQYEEEPKSISNIYDVAIASGIQIIIFLSGLQTISAASYMLLDIV